ncbi:MAG: DNA repair protein RadA [Spirochaetales bacterium]|nr:DNA repair protein RadA [Spirochaetales bacterium]
MAKAKTVFSCSSCGHEEPKWLGRCPGCGEWNSFKEKKLPSPGAASPAGFPRTTDEPRSLSSISIENRVRRSTGIPEADQVLGGGLVEGSAVLLGGEPGIGKSTLMLQIAFQAAADREVLYISGEESPGQIKLRAERLGINSDNLILFCESSVEEILTTLDKRKPGLVIMDSIQTIHSPTQGLVPGTVNQLKYGCFELINWIRSRDAVLFLIAHVTKEGAIAGPKVIEHMVDTVLYFDHSGNELRVLRSTKNRFGSVDEIGLFNMGPTGLEQVSHPEGMFLENREGELPAGISVAPVFEGSRVLLVEIQSLTVPAKGAVSRIFSDRVENGRISRVAAIMEKHLGVKFSDQDIYINVAGGMKITEIGMELPLALAIYSARTGVQIPSDLIALGEMSLTGEIRPVPQLRKRLKAAEEMGFKRVLLPGESPEAKEWKGSPPLIARDIKEAVRKVFSAS